MSMELTAKDRKSMCDLYLYIRTHTHALALMALILKAAWLLGLIEPKPFGFNSGFWL